MFAKLHQTNGTPYIAILFGGSIMIAMAGLLPIKDVAASADIMFLLLFVLVCITVIRFRKLRPDLERPFKSPFFPVLQIIGIVSGPALSIATYHLSPQAWITAGNLVCDRRDPVLALQQAENSKLRTVTPSQSLHGHDR